LSKAALQALPGNVHSGFKNRFESIASDEAYEQDLKQALNQASKILFTGHSLGAAIASLAALDCKLRYALACHNP